MKPWQHLCMGLLVICGIILSTTEAQVPVNGGWSKWGEWIVVSCPVTCGGSTTQRHRTRECTNPRPANGGADCPGLPFEYESFSCGDELCPVPVNGGWSMWGEWIVGSCPVTCGGSTTQRLRTRECTNPPPANGGADCPGLRYVQESFSCGDGLCPGGNAWSDWGSWGSPMCSVTCGSSVVGVRRRTRTCTNTKNGGCVGPSLEEENTPCGFQPCSYFEQSLSDTAARPGGLVDLNVTTIQSGLTGSWYKNNQMLSSSERVQIQSSGAVHTLTISDLRISDTGRYDFTVNVETTSAYLIVSGAGPIKGQWSNWSRWTNISTCPATCETSSAITRRRYRQCNIRTLKNIVQFCVGTGTQTESFQCGTDPCVVDGVGRNGITGGVLSVQLLVVYLFRVLELDTERALI